MYYGEPDFKEFVNYVVSNYKAHEQDVYKMVDDEYLDRLKTTPLRRTRNNKLALFRDALDACKMWLGEERKDIKPIDIVWYRPAKNFFNAIEKKEW